MHNIKKFQDWLAENAQLNKTSIDNPGGYIYSPVEEDNDKPSNYMFFQNLKRINELVSMLLEMDKEKIDKMLNDEHDWANEHVSTAKTNLDHVFEFFNGVIRESLIESTGFSRQYDMELSWWNDWKKENENDFEIETDDFEKTHTVKDEGNVIFVYDYRRNRVFTDKKPDMFILKGEKSKEEKKDKKEENSKKAEESARMIGTGTYTSTTSDPSPMTPGKHNVEDPSSGGSIHFR